MPLEVRLAALSPRATAVMTSWDTKASCVNAGTSLALARWILGPRSPWLAHAFANKQAAAQQANQRLDVVTEASIPICQTVSCQNRGGERCSKYGTLPSGYSARISNKATSGAGEVAWAAFCDGFYAFFVVVGALQMPLLKPFDVGGFLHFVGNVAADLFAQ